MKINIDSVTHTYDVDVLEDVSLTLEGYQCVALIGVSGSGKSTLIRLLAGLEKPSSGTITIDEQDVLSEEYKRKIGFVFQKHNLFPHLTLKKNISLILEKTRNFSKKEASEKADYYLEIMHLKEQANKLPKNVSGGEAQRASLARALSIEPQIIFLDEPTSSLDPVLTHEVLTAVEDLRDSGKNFIFITHVISFVKDFADYVIYMEKGKIVEHGSPDILENPKTESLKEFMGKVR
ncbi:MAG: amino acid ABC transporter ATP-binding protein [Acholeplasmataceae bacterium]|jgi:polar amino acid transport system ATP-binding protein|nr:amino acid ABC transporter ATP-binding protein [Acholeplasmataceae bacterium]